jgi:hypothetical protein
MIELYDMQKRLRDAKDHIARSSPGGLRALLNVTIEAVIRLDEQDQAARTAVDVLRRWQEGIPYTKCWPHVQRHPANAGLAGCVANAIGDFSAGGSTLPADLFNVLGSTVMAHRMSAAALQQQWWQNQPVLLREVAMQDQDAIRDQVLLKRLWDPDGYHAGERAAAEEMQAQLTAIREQLNRLPPDDPARPPEPALTP